LAPHTLSIRGGNHRTDFVSTEHVFLIFSIFGGRRNYLSHRTGVLASTTWCTMCKVRQTIVLTLPNPSVTFGFQGALAY
jgi:hypothetical protein